MATTYVDFVPSNAAPFQFQATLDDVSYNVIVTWNLFGRRYYVNVYALDGTLQIATAMVGSPVGYDISLVAGLFTSKLVYRAPNNQFEVIS